jgi:hypothetical protein
MLIKYSPIKKLLLDKLAEDQEKDLRYGFTHSGPHRADFQLLIESRKVKDFVSRGQLKLLMLSCETLFFGNNSMFHVKHFVLTNFLQVTKFILFSRR